MVSKTNQNLHINRNLKQNLNSGHCLIIFILYYFSKYLSKLYIYKSLYKS